MTREEDELSEGRHLDSILAGRDMTPDGYPGEREWELAHPEETLARDHAQAEAYRKAEEALLAEVEADFLDLVNNSGTGSEVSRGLKK